MYLTSQRVCAPGGGRTDINTFLYRHEESVPGVDWSRPDLIRVVDTFPGTLVAADTRIPPGGNQVWSYLDIVAADSTAAEELDLALRQFAREWSPERMARVVQVGKVAMRLDLVEPSRQAHALEELEELSQRALGLLHNPAPSGWATTEPLRVIVKEYGGEHKYALDAASRARLQSRHEPGWLPASITVAHEDRAAMACNPVTLCLHVAPLLTKLDLDELIPFGGIRFVEESSGEVLWEWPSRAPLVGYCLNCHQQATLRQMRDGFRCVSCGNLQDTDGLWVATLT